MAETPSTDSPRAYFCRLGKTHIQIWYRTGEYELVEIPTARELKLLWLKCVARASYEEIGDKFCISERAAENMGSKINKKLGETNIHLSGIKAMALGLIRLPRFEERMLPSVNNSGELFLN